MNDDISPKTQNCLLRVISSNDSLSLSLSLSLCLAFHLFSSYLLRCVNEYLFHFYNEKNEIILFIYLLNIKNNRMHCM